MDKSIAVLIGALTGDVTGCLIGMSVWPNAPIGAVFVVLIAAMFIGGCLGAIASK